MKVMGCKNKKQRTKSNLEFFFLERFFCAPFSFLEGENMIDE
jgi:hypothetical protein